MMLFLLYSGCLLPSLSVVHIVLAYLVDLVLQFCVLGPQFLGDQSGLLYFSQKTVPLFF